MDIQNFLIHLRVKGHFSTRLYIPFRKYINRLKKSGDNNSLLKCNSPGSYESPALKLRFNFFATRVCMKMHSK